jgi:transitional endoplasmic reticulum ATPase
MGMTLHEDDFVFDSEHFVSEYERYAALVLSRVSHVSRAATAQLFADWDRRELLALPKRDDGMAHRNRLDASEIEPLTHALKAREHAIDALGGFHAPVFRNVDALGDRLGLAPCERALLTLAVIAESTRTLRDALERFATLVRDRPTAARTLAALLGQSPSATRAAIAPESTLTRTGLLRLNMHDDDDPLLRARAGLAQILFDEFDADAALFAQFARRARAPTLALTDFSHLETDVEILVALLAAAARKGEAGINIMLYGPPGTGKTELARVLTSQAGLVLHEVRHTEKDGEGMTRERYSQVVVAQRLLRTVAGVALMFDETEDLLPRRGETASTALGKAAFNELLETNPVPMIWISNQIGHIDPAYLRRFAFLLEVKNPSRRVRRRIVERAFGALNVDGAWLDRVAEHSELAPGQITQAARVAALVAREIDAERVAERTLRTGMRAMGQRPASPSAAATIFDLAYLNCNADIANLVANLAAHPTGTLAFYGPPGTGKTALAAHIARTADRPLLVKRASDLLSPWVGECEQNIALAFEQAKDEGAVLTLDEAESFLADRRDARARWEITQTNELLTQMESFHGLFICSTNLIDRLDRAALRRFAVKVKFDYLQPDQVNALVAETLRKLGAAEDLDRALPKLARLQRVTPGDIAAVMKRCQALGAVLNAELFVRWVKEEIEMKGEGAAQPIGF